MTTIYKKKRREIQKEIQWFLDFINIKDFNEDLSSSDKKDIKRLSIADIAKLARVIETYTRYQKLGEHQDYEPIDPSLMKILVGEEKSERLASYKKRLASFHKRISDFFRYMTNRIKYTFDLEEKGWTTSGNSDFYPVLNRGTIKTKYDLKVDGLEFESKRKNDRPVSYRLIPESLSEATITTTYESSIAENFFLYSFINLINGIPISAFKECPECGKWFVNLTKRKRIFCTNLCGARKNEREKRAESKKKREAGDLVEIKKYERGLMENRLRSRKSYENKVIKKNPNAKIQSRPRKPYPTKK